MYFQNTEHVKKLLTQIDIRSTHWGFTLLKPSNRETVHAPCKISTWGNILMQKDNYFTHDFLIINHWENNPPCYLNRDHGRMGC